MLSTSTGYASHRFGDAENGSPAQLTIEYTAVPESSTFVLAALGLVSLRFAALRKKYRQGRSGPAVS